MSGHEDRFDELTAAEQRLYEHLDVLRERAPHAPGTITRRVIQTARWQQAVRRPLLSIGALAATVVHAVRLLLTPPDSRS